MDAEAIQKRKAKEKSDLTLVVIDLEAHVSNEGDILHPILGVEDKVRNFFSLLVNCDSGGGCFGCRQFPPKLIERPCSSTLTHRSTAWRMPGIVLLRKKWRETSSLHGSSHTADGDEIINTPARLGVDESLGNLL